jgi:hypothetical protein
MNGKFYLESGSLSIKITPEIVKELRKKIIDFRCQQCGSKLGIGCDENICYVLCRKNSKEHMSGYEIKKDFKLEKKPYIYKLDLRD